MEILVEFLGIEEELRSTMRFPPREAQPTTEIEGKEGEKGEEEEEEEEVVVIVRVEEVERERFPLTVRLEDSVKSTVVLRSPHRKLAT